MQRISPTRLFLAGLLACVATALADTVTLKSGAKIEGKILEETATEVTIEYKESAGIVDRKVVKRDEIASIDKETPDTGAWNALKGTRPAANSLPATQYDELLRPLTAFVAAYPASPYLNEAKQLATAFEEEKKRVDAGEVKIADKWLTKEEAEKERYQINGMIAYNHMRTQAAGGDLVGALNTFQQIEKSYGGAKTFPDAVELAKQVLPSLKATVERAYKNLQTEAAGRQQAAPQSRAELEAAAKRDEDAGAAAIATADRAGLKWPPLNIRSSKSLAKIAERVNTETPRIGALPVAAMRQSIAATEQAKTAFAANDLDGAAAALQEATKGWEPNETAKRLAIEIAEAKKALAEFAKTAATAAAAAKPVEAAPVEKKPARTAAAAVQSVAEEAKPFFKSTGGIIVIVVAIAAVLISVRVINAIRRRRSEEDEP